jgi:phosphohistidine swiveling domain-containing protein
MHMKTLFATLIAKASFAAIKKIASVLPADEALAQAAAVVSQASTEPLQTET